MPLVITFFITAGFLCICCHDFKSRKVYLVNYLILYLLYGIYIVSGSFTIKPNHIVFNVCISLVMASMLLMYYLVRYRTGAFHQIRSSIGWGDVMIIPFFIISFSPFNFVLFYMTSLIFSLVYLLVEYLFRNNTTIPLAGIQAVVLAACHISHITGFINMQNDLYPFL